MSKLNELTGKEWIKSTKSWFLLKGKSRDDKVINHPAKYPEELAEKFITFFTKTNEIVFDPFIGVGSTGVASARLGRKCVGIDVNSSFIDVAMTRDTSTTYINGDSRNFELFENLECDFVITSPPYWNMLRKKRGNSTSQHSLREGKTLSLYYSEESNDIGNIEDYDHFLVELKKIFRNTYAVVRKNGYMVVVIQNFRNSDGVYMTLAWDIVKKIEECGFRFEGEQIWCQDDKTLGIWGYPSTFISNIHHHYCLIFKKYA
jgi:DNA modification methylase